MNRNLIPMNNFLPATESVHNHPSIIFCRRRRSQSIRNPGIKNKEHAR